MRQIAQVEPKAETVAPLGYDTRIFPDPPSAREANTDLIEKVRTILVAFSHMLDCKGRVSIINSFSISY